MEARDVRTLPGTWFPIGQDQRGSEAWAVIVLAKEVKSEVKFQLDRWKSELELAERNESKIEVPWSNWYVRHYWSLRGTWIYEDGLNRQRLEICESSVEQWKKWSTFLAAMPDDEVLSLTKKDYEMFFGERDKREGRSS